jgi:erythromycin esterase-like protein
VLTQGLSAALILALSTAAQAQTQPTPTLEQALIQSRSSLILNDNNFSGPGTLVLTTAVQQSRFVLLGEDHITREIPLFAAALCDIMHPDAYAVEVGPYAARFVNGLLANPDRIPLMAARNRAFPNNMAFLDMREENDLAAHCAASSRNPHFALWGLDQEFLGAAPTLLQSMAATNPGPLSRAAIAAAQAKDRAAATLATTTGDYAQLFLPASTDAEIQALQSAIDADGTPATRDLLHEFTLSRTIYRLFPQSPSDSNLARSQLLKQHFLAYYLPFKQLTPSPRILLKFGDNHTGKGFDTLHQLNIGDFIAELAAGEQAQSLHLLVLGARGMHYAPAGYGKPFGQQPFVMSDDPDFKWLALAASNLIPANPTASGTPDSPDAQLTLFDLRQLRYRGIDLPPQWEHIVYSYDLLILIPHLSVASPIH